MRKILCTVRLSRPPDIEWLVPWEGDSETARWLGEVGPEWHHRALSDPDQEHLVAATETHIVGYAVLAGCASRQRVIEIRRMAIHPEFRGAGLGKLLLRHLVHRSYDHRRATSVWLDVKVANRRAMSVYELGGFEVRRIQANAMVEPDGTRSDLVIMEHRAK